MVKKTASSHKFSLLLYRLINFLQIKNVLETGTSLGINTAYLSQSNAHQIVTIEGSPEIAERAKTRLSKLGLNNVEIIVGRVQEVFYPALVRSQPNLVFLDADHRSETIGFYLQRIKDSGLTIDCIVIHDIYWSRDMHAAWAAIVSNPQYTLTIDIFEAGIIFPNYPIEKQHFTLKF